MGNAATSKKGDPAENGMSLNFFYFGIDLQTGYGRLYNKFRRIGVPTRDSISRRILKLCVLGRVEAR